MKPRQRLNVLYTDIGRGHPFYLDGLVSCLRAGYAGSIELEITSVMSVSGGLSLKLWRTVRSLYRAGSQGGLKSALYTMLRGKNRPRRGGLITGLLGRDLVRYIHEHRHPTVVAHPLLVPLLAESVPVYYMHGEIAAPEAAAAEGASRVYVPLDETARCLVAYGLKPESMVLTGLCIEPALADRAAVMVTKRINRLQHHDRLVGAFYSSGAEPAPHLAKMLAALDSLERAGQKAIVFCPAGGRLEAALLDRINVRRFKAGVPGESFIDAIRDTNILTVIYSDRKQLDSSTASLFKYFDYLVAPSHERSNWAAGLGLPMFITGPSIGPFSPLNREFLLRQEVAVDLDTDEKAGTLAGILADMLDSGKLAAMARNGTGGYAIDGFSRAASDLAAAITGGAAV